jgi:hypothetical protein
MMTPMQKAARRVLEAWDATILRLARDRRLQEAMEALRAEMAEPTTEDSSAVEPVQEPIGFANANALQGLTLGLYGYAEIYTDDSAGRIPVYAAPQRPAQPQEPTGCAHCTHPLYAGVKCRSCGRARA